MHMMKKIFNNSRSPFYKFGQMMQLKRISKEYWLPYIVNNFEAKDVFSFVDPLFELWLKREYGIV